MNAPFLHNPLTESKNTFLNEPLASDIIYGDSGYFIFHSKIWTYPHETVFPMLYGEGYTIHEHLAPFRFVYLKKHTGVFTEGPDIGTSGLYNNLSIDDDLGNVNSSIETGCNTHRQTDWVKDKPGQEAYFDKNFTSKDDPDLKGRIYVGKTSSEHRENNFLYYGDEKGDLHQLPLPIFALKEDTREASGQGDNISLYFDGNRLHIIDKSTGRGVYNTIAYSGRGDGMNNPASQNQKSIGPIPQGNYSFQMSNIQTISTLDNVAGSVGGLLGQKWGGWPGGTYSWGDTRVFLTPSEYTNTYGRGGFSIHGGYSPGSAGCIDLVGNNNAFFNALQNATGGQNLVILRVRY